MNSNSRNVWYAVGALVLVIAVAWYVGFRVDSTTPEGTIPATGTSTVDGTEGSTNSNGTNGTQSGSQAGNGSVSGTGSSAVLSDAALNTIISNSLVRTPQGGVDVALTRGQAAFKDGNKDARLSVGPVLARLPVDDGTTDAFAVITYSTNGQTDSQYLAVFHVAGQNVRHTSSLRVGTGVAVRSVQGSIDPAVQIQNTPKLSSVLGYKVTINYLTQKTGEPTSASPTVAQSMTATVKTHTISR